MKVFIPTKNRAATISTHQAFEGEDYTVVVHDETQKALYCENPTIEPSRVVVSGVPGDTFGLTRQREWVCRNLVEPGEWFVFADDNIKSLSAVPEPHYLEPSLPVQDDKSLKEVYDTPCSPARFMEIGREMCQEAGRVGANLCGFATTGNFFFRGRKYRYAGYVIGKLMLWCNQPDFEFDHTVSMEDFRNTAEHLYRYGAVLINNYVFPVAGHYEQGGMGTYEERIPIRKRDVKLLLKQYPGLFRVKDRPGFEPNTDLALRIHHPRQIQQWRRDLPRLRLKARGINVRGV
jgi:hypothetical protein